MSKDVVSGVGARYAEAFILDPLTGLPACAFNSGTLVGGTLIQGIKTFAYNNPAPQKFSHYGEDYAFAQDSLPATEVGSFTVTTAKTNLALDTFTEGTKLVTFDSNVEMRAGNTDNRGSEPQLFVNVFRQAIDTQNGSSTFGKLRQWHSALIPSTRIINALQSMEQGPTVKTYEGIPTPVSVTPWNQIIDSSIFGATRGEYIEATTTYKPVWAFGLGNGTLVTFALPKPPIDVAHTHATVNGTLATVSSVNTSTTNPTMTLSSAPGGIGSGGAGTGGAALIGVLIEHSQPR